MYAIIRTGGRQYKVAQDEVLQIEKIEGEEGVEVTFNDVLMLGGESVSIGTPNVTGAMVKGIIEKQGRGEKILVYKFKRRKNYQKMNGHRQPFTQVKITSIVG